MDNPTPAQDVLKKIDKALATVADLCEGKIKWTMHVPAEHDRDPDLVIADALMTAKSLIATLPAQDAAIASDVRDAALEEAAAMFDPHPHAEMFRTNIAADIRALKSSPLPMANEDRERLDFLDRLNAALNKRYGTAYGWKLILSPNVVRLMSGRQEKGYVGDIDLNDSGCRHESFSSCRAAIDAARKAKS